MTPLVLVHGFMGGSAQWAGQQAALGGRFGVIAVDLPGFGLNNGAEALDTIGAYANFVLDTVTRRGVGRFHLLGHSMGGMIAQEMAAAAPRRIDRLVLYATGAAGVLPGRFETLAQSRRRAMKDGPAATARRISATWFLEREAAPGYEACAAIAQRASPQAVRAGLDAMEAWSGVGNLHGISGPALVLWGDGDRTYPWPQTERLWRTLPDARLAVAPGCAHAVHLEKPDIFNALVADFLQ